MESFTDGKTSKAKSKAEIESYWQPQLIGFIHQHYPSTQQFDTVSVTDATDEVDCSSLAHDKDCELDTPLVNESHQELKLVADIVDTTACEVGSMPRVDVPSIVRVSSEVHFSDVDVPSIDITSDAVPISTVQDTFEDSDQPKTPASSNTTQRYKHNPGYIKLFL